jgi:hypothetical protein
VALQDFRCYFEVFCSGLKEESHGCRWGIQRTTSLPCEFWIYHRLLLLVSRVITSACDIFMLSISQVVISQKKKSGCQLYKKNYHARFCYFCTSLVHYLKISHIPCKSYVLRHGCKLAADWKTGKQQMVSIPIWWTSMWCLENLSHRRSNTTAVILLNYCQQWHEL